jgi:hypothetical protein
MRGQVPRRLMNPPPPFVLGPLVPPPAPIPPQSPAPPPPRSRAG